MSFRKRVAVGFSLMTLAALSCAPRQGEPLVGVNVPSGEYPVAFSFRRATGEGPERLGNEQYLGSPLLLAFATTEDLVAQAELVALARAEREKPFGIPVLLVFLASPAQEPLVPPYVRALDLPFTAVLADEETRNGGGPFALAAVPTLILLDAASHIAWKNPGVAHPADVRQKVAALSH